MKRKHQHNASFFGKKKKLVIKFLFLAGLVGFEHTHARVKVWCLTAWLQPNVKICAMVIVQLYKWGGRWDSNPRPPVPQTGALTNCATSTIS